MKREELLVNAKPILFNTEMVRAILEDRKTVTRRVLKPKLRDGEYGCHIWFNKTLNRHIVEKYDEDESDFTPTRYVNQPYEVGDILYVRETYRDVIVGLAGFEGEAMWTDDVIQYKASQEEFEEKYEGLIGEYSKWHPSIHMPKEAARIFLKVTSVRVERLQEITSKEAIKEGLKDKYAYGEYNSMEPKKLFIDLWNSTINKHDFDLYGWEADPFVWVIEFERINYE